MSKRTAIRRSKRILSINHTFSLRYSNDVKKFKEWCENNEIPYLDFDCAEPTDICVLSTVDYDLGEMRQNIEVDNKSYFLHQDDYETWKNQ